MFTVRGVVLIEALSNIKKVIGASADAIQCYYDSKKGDLVIRADKDNHATQVEIRVPCTGKGKSEKFEASIKILEDLCKNRQEIDFEVVSESKIKFKAHKGSYKGEFTFGPYKEIEVLDPTVEASKLSVELQEELLTWLPKMKIDAFFTEESMAVLIEADKDGLRMACADSYHGVAYIGEKSLGKLELAIPVQYIDLITAFLDVKGNIKGESSLATNGASLFFWNKRIAFKVPLIASNKQLDLVLANTRVKGASTKIDSEHLPGILDNLAAVYEDKASVLCETDGEKLTFTLQTGFGKASDVVKLLKPLPKSSFRIEPLIFRVLVSKMSGKITFSLGGEKKEWTTLLMSQKAGNGKFTAFCITVEK